MGRGEPSAEHTVFLPSWWQMEDVFCPALLGIPWSALSAHYEKDHLARKPMPVLGLPAGGRISIGKAVVTRVLPTDTDCCPAQMPECDFGPHSLAR